MSKDDFLTIYVGYCYSDIFIEDFLLSQDENLDQKVNIDLVGFIRLNNCFFYVCNQGVPNNLLNNMIDYANRYMLILRPAKKRDEKGGIRVFPDWARIFYYDKNSEVFIQW